MSPRGCVRAVAVASVAAFAALGCGGGRPHRAPPYSTEGTRSAGGSSYGAPAPGMTTSVGPVASDDTDAMRQLLDAEAELEGVLAGRSTEEGGAELGVEAEELSVPPRPDCNAAPALRDRICALAEHICRLADDHPGDEALAERCRNARGSCKRARADVAEACESSPQ